MPTTSGNLYGGGSPTPDYGYDQAALHEAASQAKPVENVISLSKNDIDILIRHQVNSFKWFSLEASGTTKIYDENKGPEHLNINYLEKQVKRLQELIDMRKKV